MRKLFLLCSGLALLSGCVSNLDIRKKEVDALREVQTKPIPRFYDITEFDESLKYSHRLSEAYILIADRAALGQDVLAAGILAAAGTAAGALLFDASLDLVRGAGLAAGAILQTEDYLEPDETITHLLDTSEKLICIVIAGRATRSGMLEIHYGNDTVDPGGVFDQERTSLVIDGIAQARLQLRRLVRRELPSYGTITRDLLASARQDVESIGTRSLARADQTALARQALAEANSQLKREIGVCLLPT